MKLLNRIISKTLIIAILFNCNADIFAQSASKTETQARPSLSKQKVDNARMGDKRLNEIRSNPADQEKKMKQVLKYNRFVPPSMRIKNVRAQVGTMNYLDALKYEKMLKEDDVYRRAEEIKYVIFQKEELPSIKKFTADFTKAVEEQEKLIISAINKNYNRQLKQITQSAAEYNSREFPQAQILVWTQKTESELKQWKEEALSELKKRKEEELTRQNIQKRYEEEIAAIKQQQQTSDAKVDQEVMEELKILAAEIMNLYKRKPEAVLPSLLEVTPALLTVSHEDNELFTKVDKMHLMRIYKYVLENPGEKCEKEGQCDLEINAISGLGILGQYSEDGYPIVEFLEKHEKHADYTRILITSISALVNMKSYGTVGGYLNSASERENSISEFDIFDFELMAKEFNNRRGKYLGELSQYARYNESGRINNAWTDVAFILAEDNTQGSLNLLKKYGVEKCRVFQEVKINFDKELKLRCSGIQPFLVGALLSGKSGANQYTQEYNRAGNHLTAQGRGVTVTRDDENRSRANAEGLMYNFDALAKQKGLAKDALLALFIINKSMGDLSVHEESVLDTDIYSVFGKSIKKYLNGNAVIRDNNSKEYQSNIKRKESRVQEAKIISNIGTGLNIGFLVWCFWDLSRLATKGLRGIGRLGKQTYRGMKLARIGNNANKMAFLRENLAVYQKTFANRKNPTYFAKVSQKIKKGLEPAVLGNYKHFGSTAPEFIGPRTVTGELIPSVAQEAIQAADFNARAGRVIVNPETIFQARTAVNLEAYAAGRNLKNTAARKDLADLLHVERNFINASRNAAKEFDVITAARSKRPLVFSSPSKDAKLSHKLLARETGKLFTDSKFLDRRAMLAGQALSGSVANMASIASGKYGAKLVDTLFSKGKKRSLILFKGSEQKQVGNVRVFLTEAIPGVTGTWLKKIPFIKNTRLADMALGKKTNKLSSVIIENKNAGSDQQFLRFVRSDNTGIDPSFFKITVNKESVPSLLRASHLAVNGKAGAALKLKVNADYTAPGSIWAKIKSSAQASKETQYTEELAVVLKNGSNELPLNGVSISANKNLKGFKLAITHNDETMLITPEGKVFNGNFSVTLPKEQIGRFTEIAGNANFLDKNIAISLSGSKNKINTLFVLSGLSLSAASTSLIKPLSDIYANNNIPEGERDPWIGLKLGAISVALPYLPSLISPVISPFVRRYGMVNVLKSSLVIASGALVIPMAYGFNGSNGISYKNREDFSLAPLAVSAFLIGVSTALTRSTLSPLTDAIGGGGNTLKTMAFKNLSSFIMITPPALVTGGVMSYRAAFKDASENDFSKKVVDFSVSYPILLAATMGTGLLLHKTKISTKIGKADGPKIPFKDFRKGLKGDVIESFKTIKNPIVGKTVLASTLVVGAEAALVNSYSMGEVNRYSDIAVPKKEGENVLLGDARKLASVGVFVAAPFMFRLSSNKVIKALGGGENPLAYKKLLVGSLGTAALGSTVLYTQDNLPLFLTGMALTSVGFASTTNGFFKLSKIMLKDAKMSKSFITNFEVLYPGVHIGMAAVPALTNLGSDIILKNNMAEDRAESNQKSLVVPMLGIAAGTFAGSKILGINRKSIVSGFRTFGSASKMIGLSLKTTGVNFGKSLNGGAQTMFKLVNDSHAVGIGGGAYYLNKALNSAPAIKDINGNNINTINKDSAVSKDSLDIDLTSQRNPVLEPSAEETEKSENTQSFVNSEYEIALQAM